jgi:hypothetical protein
MPVSIKSSRMRVVVVIFQIPTIIANIRIPYQEITQGDTVVIGNLLATLILDAMTTVSP